MKKGVIETVSRSTIRNMRSAMQGNVIRALVELITNSDDSYIRLEEENINHRGEIFIHYRKKGYHGYFSVRDHAEGMTYEKILESFRKYGKATSGLKEGKRVRGYFGHGAKDALITMINGRICSFKDGQFVRCRLFIENEEPRYAIDGPLKAPNRLREKHSIEENGTVAYFEADPDEDIRVPNLKTILEQLSNNYLLRKIMLNPNREVILVDDDSSKKYELNYRLPPGNELINKNINIHTEKYGDFPIEINIWRANSELTQTGDDRQGGLLIVDEEDVVLDLSLFTYDNEPLASHFFGEVKIHNFRRLLTKEEPVLSDNREGLSKRHPFCKKFISRIEEYLKEEVNNERKRKRQEIKSKLDREERARFKKAFSLLNEIAEKEAEAITNLGEEPSDEVEDPPNGFCLYPSKATITVEKKYGFELRINTEIVRKGSRINLKSTNNKIKILTAKINLDEENNSRIIQKYISVEASEANIEGTLIASAGSLQTQSSIFVEPEKEFLLTEGMVFEPESLTLRPNKVRKAKLYVYTKMISAASEIKINSDNEAIHVSENNITVVEADADRHIAKFELEVWGDGVDQDALITAEYQHYLAILSAKVKPKKESPDKGHKGMFREPRYDPTPDPRQRSHYSSETGNVIIYTEFPSVKFYLGKLAKFKKTLPAQIFIADLVAEACFQEIAKMKVEKSGSLIRPDAKQDRIRRDKNELSKKYGREVHEALVNQKLLEASRNR